MNTLADHDPRTLFAAAATTAGDLIATVQEAELHLPTPCDRFDVAGLLDHLDAVLRRVIALAEGTDPMAIQETLATPEQGWVVNWQQRSADVATAWADPAKLSESMTLPWASGPGAALLGTYTAELTVHTWDLAEALGREAAWDGNVLDAALAAYHFVLPVADRGEMFGAMLGSLPAGWEPPFRNAVDLPADAPTIDRIIAWTGRQP